MDEPTTLVMCSFCGNSYPYEDGFLGKPELKTNSCKRCFAICKVGDKVRFAAPGRDTFNWGSQGLDPERIYTVTKRRQYHHGLGVWVNGMDKEFHSMIFVPADFQLAPLVQKPVENPQA